MELITIRWISMYVSQQVVLTYQSCLGIETILFQLDRLPTKKPGVLKMLTTKYFKCSPLSASRKSLNLC